MIFTDARWLEGKYVRKVSVIDNPISVSHLGIPSIFRLRIQAVFTVNSDHVPFLDAATYSSYAQVRIHPAPLNK
jgi:hypothetical protein